MPAPRLLLFGPPGAGKSSLIAALGQAAPEVKAETILDTPDLQQLRIEKKGSDRYSEVAVFDCSGKVAREMLEAEKPFANSHPLKARILEADGIVLVIDVSAPERQAQEEFRQAAKWLRALHEFRGRRADVGAFPVYVVLSKCDKLVTKDDTLQTWKERIEQKKHKYIKNFNKFLKEQSPGFGTLDLKVLATATKPPVFGDKKAPEPFGVAEWFNDSAKSAAEFQERRYRAQSAMQNVIAGLLGLLVILGLSVLLLLVFQPESRTNALEERVPVLVRRAESPAEKRLQGTPKVLAEKLRQLNEVEHHPDFVRLAKETRDAISEYRAEMDEYVKKTTEAEPIMKLPFVAKNQKEFDEQEKAVRGFTLSEAQTREWADTRLVRQVTKVRGEYDALHAALKEEVAWIRRETEKTDRLLKDGSRIFSKVVNGEKGARAEADAWAKQKDALKYEPHEPRDKDVPGVTRIIYDDLGRFDAVQKAQKDWTTSKNKLGEIAKLIEKS